MEQLAVRAAQEVPNDDPCPPIGELIGFGKQRWVYAQLNSLSVVVKLLRPEWERVNSNAAEWRNWQRIRQTEYAPYFAPCLAIGGRWLTMVRCDPLLSGMSCRIPAICSDDPTRKNFGTLDGRLVCLDYANMLPEQITDTAKMIKWRFQ